MTITASSGAEVTGPYPIGNAAFEYNLRMPPQPGRVDVHGRMISNDGEYTVEYDAPPVWSVNADLTSVQPDPLPVGVFGNVEADVVVLGAIDPPEFQSGEFELEIERSGVVVSRSTQPSAIATF